jgi:hypothetical protein
MNPILRKRWNEWHTSNYFCLGATWVYSKMNTERREDLCSFKNQVVGIDWTNLTVSGEVFWDVNITLTHK